MTTQIITIGKVDRHTSVVAATSSVQPRLFFVDNLRILLTLLVVLHHLAITYGAVGSWAYKEGAPDMLTTFLLTLFTGVNQSFFMGFFFMIAGYFTPGAYDRKGGERFLKGRLLRLAVPLLFYLTVLHPLFAYALAVNRYGFGGSFWNFLAGYLANYGGLETGPLWFVETLLIFSLCYALWRYLTNHPVASRWHQSQMPGNWAIAMFALGLGVVTFIVRIWLPEDWWFGLLNLPLPYFPQYISLFILGIVAYRRNWFVEISEARGKLWGGIAIIFIVLMPILFVAGGALEGDTIPFIGGIHWQSLAFSVLQHFLCLGMVIGLLALFRHRLNHQNPLGKTMAASTYTVYLIHQPVLVFVALALSGINLYPLFKFPVVALVVAPLCLLLAYYIRRLPLARNIL